MEIYSILSTIFYGISCVFEYSFLLIFLWKPSRLMHSVTAVLFSVCDNDDQETCDGQSGCSWTGGCDYKGE